MANVIESVTKSAIASRWSWLDSTASESQPTTPAHRGLRPKFSPLRPLREWLNNVKVQDVDLAHHLCYLIPAQCPFERDVKLFGRTLFHIPPMCKLNPFYEELVMLRFRALCYLADECGEDISAYC